MFAYDAELGLRWVKNAPREFTEDGFMALLECAEIEGVSARTFSDAVKAVTRTKEPFYGVCTVVISGVSRRFEVSLNPHINDRILGVAYDSGRHTADDRAIRSLSLELAHRTKNLMAVISSLATQTARRFDNFAEFKARFTGQIGALSHAHDAIASTGWDGAILERIATAQIRYDRPHADVTITGDALNVMLTPNAAQNLAMVLNELAGVAEGTARIRFEATLLEDGRLSMVWTTGHPVPVGELWLDLLTKVAPMTLDGTGEIIENEYKFSYALTCRADHFVQGVTPDKA